jgi:hypothetical protein
MGSIRCGWSIGPPVTSWKLLKEHFKERSIIMKTLTWQQVNTWRLDQQNISHRLPPGELVQALSQSMGVHAQVKSAAEMAIGARVVGLSPQDIQLALWQERTLIKTWLMRYTLYLIPSTDFPKYLAARSQTDRDWPAVFAQSGVDRATFDAYLATAPEILDKCPITRQQFIEAIIGRIKSPELSDLLMNGGWGIAFKPLAARGELCFGPNIGNTTTFIRPAAWIHGWQAQDPEAAMREVVRHYLMVYGPARPRNFQVWWWMTGVAAKKAFNSIADETEEVNVEGWHAIALKPVINSMLELEPTGIVHLLPAFDVYTIGLARGMDLERLFAIDQQKKVYLPQGWVSAVVLVDGFVKGIWEYKEFRSVISVTIELFSPATDRIKEGIAIEADRLGKFLNSPIQLEFTQL